MCVATGFGELWLQPSGSVGLMGAAAAGTFVRGALDRAHVEPLFAQRHEYKNAADTFLRTEFTEAHREATERLAESAYEQIVSAVSAGRRLPADRVRELIDRAPIPAAEAQEAGLVDHLGYRDAVRQAVDRRWAEKPTLLYVSRYQRRWDNVRRACQARRPAVGLIEAIGTIRTGRSKPGPVGRAAGSDTVAAAFRSAVQRRTHKGDRVPGQQSAAAPTSPRTRSGARCAALARPAKPVVVSMGDVAGSGGYFVAMAADVIVAQPATLTGSIGVLRRQAPDQRPARALGRARREPRPRAARAHVLVADRFSEDEWAKLDEWLDFVYDDFTAKVARGRAMSAKRSTRWPAAGSGRGPTPPNAGWSTSSAGCAAPSRSPGSGAGLPARRTAATGPCSVAGAAPAPTPQQRRPGGLRPGPGIGLTAVGVGRPCPAGGGSGASGCRATDHADGAAPVGKCIASSDCAAHFRAAKWKDVQPRTSCTVLG